MLSQKKLQSFVVRLFISFWIYKYFVLFELIFLLNLTSLLSKSALLTFLAYFNFAVKYSAVNLLNSWVVIYSAWSIILFSLIAVLRKFVVTKLLESGILLPICISVCILLPFLYLKKLQSLNPLCLVFFYQYLNFFSLNFVYLCGIALYKLK